MHSNLFYYSGCMRSWREGSIYHHGNHYTLNKAFWQRALWGWVWIGGRMEEQNAGAPRRTEAHSRYLRARCLGNDAATWVLTDEVWQSLTSSVCYILPQFAAGHWEIASELILSIYGSTINYKLNWLLALWFIQQIFIELSEGLFYQKTVWP